MPKYFRCAWQKLRRESTEYWCLDTGKRINADKIAAIVKSMLDLKKKIHQKADNCRQITPPILVAEQQG